MKQEYQQKIAFIIAHPDDEHIPFGLPAQLSLEGNQVHLLSLTKGDLGSHLPITRRRIARIRAQEFANSGALLGASTKILGFSDGSLDTKEQKARIRLLRELRIIQPDVIILPNKNDYHADHVTAYDIGQWAAFHLPDGPIKTRHGFFRKRVPPVNKAVSVYQMDTQGSQVWQSTREDDGKIRDTLSPVNLIVPISEQAITQSIQAFQEHRSQLSDRGNGKIGYVELAVLGARRRGQQAGFSYGAGLSFEPFGGYAFSTENKLAEPFASRRIKLLT